MTILCTEYKITFLKWEVMMANQSPSWSDINTSCNRVCHLHFFVVQTGHPQLDAQGWDRMPQTSSITTSLHVHICTLNYSHMASLWLVWLASYASAAE